MPAVKKNKPLKKIFKKPQNVAKESSDEPITVISSQLQKKITQQKEKKDAKIAKERGVVFIKHLPHGFFEEQLKKYFEQFGAVTRLRLCRSRRTGGSKGYAFVEFQYPEVAQVATQTMNNYLMFKKVVKAAYIPPEKQFYNFFKSNVRNVKNKAGKSMYVSWKTAATQRKVKQYNNWTDEVYQKRTIANMKKINKLNKKFENSNIDFTKLALMPKTLTHEETPTNKNLEDTETETETETAGSSKQKRKTPLKVTDQPSTTAKKQKKQTQNKKEIELEDLLGRTIHEDDEEEDDDYVPVAESNDENDDEEFESTDEETYSFLKDSQEEESDSEEKVTEKKSPVLVPTKNSKKMLKEDTKFSKLDRLVQLVKHKKGGGGIKKSQKKIATTKKINANQSEKKKNMQLELAKTVAKPLSSIKMGNKNKKIN